MRIVYPSFRILFISPPRDSLKLIEVAGRTCYKSEYLISEGSAEDFIKKIVSSGHESVIEHSLISVKFVCDRGVSHELVRHRLAAYSQESTRYANYARQRFGSEITVIRPPFWDDDSVQYKIWYETMKQCERAYLDLISKGAAPQEARSVLPNSLKTEIVMSCNFREWRHVLKLRCSKRAHPQIRELMLALLEVFHKKIPVIFDDVYEQYKELIKEVPFYLKESIDNALKNIG